MSDMNSFYTSRLEIDLDCIAKNAKSLTREVGVPIMAVVKDEAYGVGALPVVQCLTEVGIHYFAVANTREALQLRQAEISQPILVFNAYSDAEVNACVDNGVTLSLNRFDMIDQIESAVRLCGRNALVHIKVDSGMGRFGVFVQDTVRLARAAIDSGCITIEGLFSHFAMIDDDPTDPFNEIQLGRFTTALSDLAEIGVHPKWVHMANSAGALNHPSARFSMVRMGSALLGMNPFYYGASPSFINNSLTWKSQLVSVRRIPAGWALSYGQTYRLNTDAWIGIVPIGYAQGFRRSRNNEVLIRGEKLPVVGSVCTDSIFVLLPEQFKPGEEVVLMGKQGDQSIEIEDLARRWGTARAEATGGISERVERVYLHGEKNK